MKQRTLSLSLTIATATLLMAAPCMAFNAPTDMTNIPGRIYKIVIVDFFEGGLGYVAAFLLFCFAIYLFATGKRLESFWSLICCVLLGAATAFVQGFGIPVPVVASATNGYVDWAVALLLSLTPVATLFALTRKRSVNPALEANSPA